MIVMQVALSLSIFFPLIVDLAYTTNVLYLLGPSLIKYQSGRRATARTFVNATLFHNMTFSVPDEIL